MPEKADIEDMYIELLGRSIPGVILKKLSLRPESRS
jgi:hypothetical protein